jgi:hypothetical protein
VGEKKILAPSRSFRMTLKIKGEEYSNDLSNVRISSSLATGYQIVTLTINVTPHTILLNKLYGQDKIMLTVALQDHAEFEVENFVFDLMIINSQFDIPISEIMITDHEANRTSYEILTVVRQPFEIMTTMVNPVLGLNPGGPTKWSGPKTVKEFIEAITSEYVPQATLDYDSSGVNEDKILQCCVPPTTLYQALKYIDTNYGVYNGTPSFFCQYDNTLQIMNLSSRIKKSFLIQVEHLSTSHKDADVEVDGITKFFTIDRIQSSYVGNARFGVMGKTIKHIVLPSDQLYHTITHDLADVCNTYGAVSKTKGETSFINTSAASRTKYYIENNGNNESETFAISKLAKEIADVSRISFTIERNIHITNLIKIGSIVKLKTKTMEHTDIQGNYIMFSSDINFTKGTDWETTCKLELIRTNNIN